MRVDSWESERLGAAGRKLEITFLRSQIQR